MIFDIYRNESVARETAKNLRRNGYSARIYAREIRVAGHRIETWVLVVKEKGGKKS